MDAAVDARIKSANCIYSMKNPMCGAHRVFRRETCLSVLLAYFYAGNPSIVLENCVVAALPTVICP